MQADLSWGSTRAARTGVSASRSPHWTRSAARPPRWATACPPPFSLANSARPPSTPTDMTRGTSSPFLTGTGATNFGRRRSGRGWRGSAPRRAPVGDRCPRAPCSTSMRSCAGARRCRARRARPPQLRAARRAGVGAAKICRGADDGRGSPSARRRRRRPSPRALAGVHRSRSPGEARHLRFGGRRRIWIEERSRSRDPCNVSAATSIRRRASVGGDSSRPTRRRRRARDPGAPAPGGRRTTGASEGAAGRASRVPLLGR